MLMQQGQQARAKSLVKRAVAINDAIRPLHPATADDSRALANIKARQTCAECHQHRAALKKCARCQAVYYCSVDCQVCTAAVPVALRLCIVALTPRARAWVRVSQKAAWPAHKPTCVPIGKTTTTTTTTAAAAAAATP